MNTRDLARALVDCLRGREITPKVINEISRCVEAVHPGDDFVGQLSRKLLGRHTRRPGPKPNFKHQRKIADAAIWARFNVRKSDNGRPTANDKFEAAKLATQQHGLSSKAQDGVYRAAFDRKDPPMNKLIRRRIRPPESLGG